MSDAEKPTIDLADSDAVIEGEDGELRAVMAKLTKHGGDGAEDSDE